MTELEYFDLRLTANNYNHCPTTLLYSFSYPHLNHTASEGGEWVRRATTGNAHAEVAYITATCTTFA